MSNVNLGVMFDRLFTIVSLPQYASAVEDMGFDSVWVPEGLVNETPEMDIIMSMSGFIHKTKKITVGTCVLLLPLRNPAILAKEVATLDFLSGGRVVLGIGVGGSLDSNPASFEVSGVSLRERGARCDENLEIMTKLWSSTAVSHKGRFYQFNNMKMEPTPVQKPHPPIWAGGVVDAVLRRTARYCDGFLPLSVNSQEYVKLWDSIERYGEQYGRDTSKITKAMLMFYNLADSREEGRRMGEDVLNKRRGFDVTLPGDGRYAFGTVQDCVQALENFVKIGVSYFVFCPIAPMQEVMDQVERLGTEILPHFR